MQKDEKIMILVDPFILHLRFNLLEGKYSSPPREVHLSNYLNIRSWYIDKKNRLKYYLGINIFLREKCHILNEHLG
jgi:hypothetical protein